MGYTIPMSSANAHVLQDTAAIDIITKRLRRANGQMGAVVRMMEEGRDCEAIVHQMAAVSKAVNTAAFTLIAASLRECLEQGTENRADVASRLEKMFLSLA